MNYFFLSSKNKNVLCLVFKSKTFVYNSVEKMNNNNNKRPISNSQHRIKRRTAMKKNLLASVATSDYDSLLEAVVKKDLNGVRVALAFGVNANERQGLALNLCLSNFERLLEQEKRKVEDIAALLLTRGGVDPNGAAGFREVPLTTACKHGLYHTAQLMIDHGADVNRTIVRSPDDGTLMLQSEMCPLHAACINIAQNARLVRLLLSRHADALHLCNCSGHPDLTVYIAEADKDHYREYIEYVKSHPSFVTAHHSTTTVSLPLQYQPIVVNLPVVNDRDNDDDDNEDDSNSNTNSIVTDDGEEDLVVDLTTTTTTTTEIIRRNFFSDGLRHSLLPPPPPPPSYPPPPPSSLSPFSALPIYITNY